MSYAEKIDSIMYMDGFHKKENHTLWKLKIKIGKKEWDKVKHLFQFYNKGDKNISKGKYFGWATVNPVAVIKIINGVKDNE